jgi:hypothetical protein
MQPSLRPSSRSGSALFMIFSGEGEIGRIFEARGGSGNRRWFWSLTINGRLIRSGHAATREKPPHCWCGVVKRKTLLLTRQLAIPGPVELSNNTRKRALERKKT